jgi:hypothetical protein
MSVSVPRFPARSSTDQIDAALREHGAVIVEDVLSPDLLARLNAELDPILDEISPRRSYLNDASSARRSSVIPIDLLAQGKL